MSFYMVWIHGDYQNDFDWFFIESTYAAARKRAIAHGTLIGDNRPWTRITEDDYADDFAMTHSAVIEKLDTYYHGA